jgi:hypothetical protein
VGHAYRIEETRNIDIVLVGKRNGNRPHGKQKDM